MPEIVGKPITIFDSVEIAVVLSLDLPPSKLDIGKLT
jgi:glyceraldehyde 3-phosphate dehydrogenase